MAENDRSNCPRTLVFPTVFCAGPGIYSDRSLVREGLRFHKENAPLAVDGALILHADLAVEVTVKQQPKLILNGLIVIDNL